MNNVKQTKGNTRPRSEHRWWALIALALAQFLVVMDSSIINIALPTIGDDLQIGTDTLSWIIAAFVVPFGGLLLLGGRLADRFGHRRIFLLGIFGFILGSTAAGMSTTLAWILIARAVQGMAAALLAPAALALLTVLFTEPAERAKALGVWGIVAGVGSGAGVLLGGVLTSMFGWSSVFFINIPVGAVVLMATPMLVTKDSAMQRTKTDVWGAMTVTAGLVALVTVLSAANLMSMTLTLILFAISLTLLVSFIFIEKRTQDPLIPFRIFRNASVTKGNLAMLWVGGGMVGLFFALSVYMQMVLQYDALTTGLTQLPLVVALILGAGLVPAFIEKIGAKSSLVISLIIFAGGLIWLSFAPWNASFVADLLGPTIVLGIGLGGALVSGTNLAVTGVAEREEGLASGLVNSSQQIGGALGIAILATVAAMRTDALSLAGHDTAQALTGGFSWVFIGAALFALTGALLVLFVQRKPHSKAAAHQDLQTSNGSITK